MAVTLGKRKRVHREQILGSPPSQPEDSGSKEDLQDAFRKAFEKKFKPLDLPPPSSQRKQEEVEDEGSDSDWSGFDTDEEEHPAIEIIEHSGVEELESMTKAEQRAFMASKPPSANPGSQSRAKRKQDVPEEDEKDEKLNLKHDLALHRLINESKLLHPDNDRGSTHKQKVLDLRLQSLGSKESFMQQEKMPLSHRKGMIAKASQKEASRRKEAKENGIILETAKKTKKPGGDAKRIRGIGGPSVGKFKGGTLSLSKRDVVGIKRG